MPLFDRSDDRSFGYRGGVDRGRGGGFLDRAQHAVRRGWDQVEDRFQGGGVDDPLRREHGGGRGWNAGGRDWSRPLDREGGLHQRNSWSDGAWTADAAERADREWNLHNREGGMDRGSDTPPFQAGWRAGGVNRGMHDRGWSPGNGEWGHAGGPGRGGYDRGFRAGGLDRGGGFVDRAGNALRRGWEQVEDRFDRDDADRMHMGGSSMRGGTSWAGRYDRDWHQPSDLRGYRDEEGHYGVAHTGGMMGGGMNRYGVDFDRGRMDLNRGRDDYDRGFKGRERMSSRGFRYDEGFRGGRDWF